MSLNDDTAELPLEPVGARLRRAREAAGLSRSDVARQTRIGERMLAALEEGNYAVLPARTYATGFARSYARAVGLDPEPVVHEVRRDLDGSVTQADRPAAPTFEPGDPARVPSRRLAWIALAALLLVLIGLATWRAANQPVAGLPSILPPDAPATPHPAAIPAAHPSSAPAPSGPVVLTAQAPAWVLVTAGGQDLLKHEMKAGESFTVPADAADPRLRTARPDLLAITVGGRPVPKLADRQTLVANVSLTATALLARSAPAASPAPSATTTASPAPPDAAASARPHPRPRPAASASPAEAAPSPTSPPAPTEPSTATQ